MKLRCVYILCRQAQYLHSLAITVSGDAGSSGWSLDRKPSNLLGSSVSSPREDLVPSTFAVSCVDYHDN